jgi:hypothetical protein
MLHANGSFPPIADISPRPKNDGVDMLDILALTGLEWLYDRIEDRYGRRAAWLVTSALALAIIGVLVWILIAVVNR